MWFVLLLFLCPRRKTTTATTHISGHFQTLRRYITLKELYLPRDPMYFYSTPSLICALIFFVAARYPHTARAVEMLDVQRLQPPQQGRSPALAMRAGTGQQQQQDRSWYLPVPQLPPLSDVRTYSSDSFLGRARGGDGPRSMLRGSSGGTVLILRQLLAFIYYTHSHYNDVLSM